jgi:hypothetical protein
VVGVGEEALLARWIGDADAVAFNRGALRRSLESIEAEPLSDPAARLAPDLVPARLRAGPELPLLAPRDWLAEPVPLAPCDGLRDPNAGLGWRWPGDFRVVVRLLWWRQPQGSSTDAASNCSDRASGLGPGSWSVGGDWLGAAWVREGLFLEHAGGLLLLDVETPLESAPLVQPVAAAWIRAHLPSP